MRDLVPTRFELSVPGCVVRRVGETPPERALPQRRLAAVIEGLRGRGLVDAAGGFTDAGRDLRVPIEAVTDELAAPAYDVLSADELGELVVGLESIAAAIEAVED